MRLWSYQHPAVLQTLQQNERYVCHWERVSGEHWQTAFRWMLQQMIEQDMQPGEYAPVWTWHSVNRIGGKPDEQCAHNLLSDYQLEQGIDLLELKVPDQVALASCYSIWNRILDRFIDGAEPEVQDILDCFAIQLRPRRGRPPRYFPDIQVCLPFIEPAWLVSWEALDTSGMLQTRNVWKSPENK